MGDVIGFEEGLIWLPSHVLEEALFDHPNTDELSQPMKKHHHRGGGGGSAFSRTTMSPAENLSLNWRQSGCRVQPKQKQQSSYWQRRGGDERMQAFFIASGRTTSGTGVFLPTTSGSSGHLNKKPPCAPVLLPSRVVRALNLNVHSLGLQISPRPDGANGRRKKERENGSTRKSGDVNPITSPEMFLPKEWTY